MPNGERRHCGRLMLHLFGPDGKRLYRCASCGRETDRETRAGRTHPIGLAPPHAPGTPSEWGRSIILEVLTEGTSS